MVHLNDIGLRHRKHKDPSPTTVTAVPGTKEAPKHKVKIISSPKIREQKTEACKDRCIYYSVCTTFAGTAIAGLTGAYTFLGPQAFFTGYAGLLAITSIFIGAQECHRIT